jgi:hypothetical protein
VLLEELAKLERLRPLSGGAQRAFMLALALEHCDIAVVGAKSIEALAHMGVRQFADLDEARAKLELQGRGARVEDIFRVVPRVRSVD